MFSSPFKVPNSERKMRIEETLEMQTGRLSKPQAKSGTTHESIKCELKWRNAITLIEKA